MRTTTDYSESYNYKISYSLYGVYKTTTNDNSIPFESATAAIKNHLESIRQAGGKIIDVKLTAVRI